jgi:hypothetical protein
MRIPALTESGGTLKRYSTAKEFRVWVKPKIGESYYYPNKSLPLAIMTATKVTKEGYVEKPLAVIRDKKSELGWREVKIPEKFFKESKNVMKSYLRKHPEEAILFSKRLKKVI